MLLQFVVLVYWRTKWNGSVLHKACCSSWCDVAWSICEPCGKALDQMWCWSDPSCLAQNQQSKAPMNLILPRTLWPRGLRRWLKAPFRKGVGSDPTGVILFGLTLRHVLHTWSGPYIQRAWTFRAMSLLHKLLPCTDHARRKFQPQQKGNQVVRSPVAAYVASARLNQQLGLRFVENVAKGRKRSSTAIAGFRNQRVATRPTERIRFPGQHVQM